MEAYREILRKYWGYDEFRPLQAEAIRAAVEGRDAVVVLPTGGGKSLCFQVPALHLDGLALVVSPLISLMKDQVDALKDCGVPAACVNSTLSAGERREVADAIRHERLKLLYLSPERLMTEQTLDFLRQVKLSLIAVDEAHCISQWGHDFRPEYRALSVLKQAFGGIAIHAYTATATPRVREDIASQLRLKEPEMLIGSFDRPNLVYRVFGRTDRLHQIGEVIDRHADESGIIYCIRRAEVDTVCAELAAAGHTAVAYHAGMSDEDRHASQDAFISDRAKIIVATVAFGMGIDKSNVRFVIHAAAPKSLESYQQESGRAGRDGLEAECCLFHSAGDFLLWKRLQQDAGGEGTQAADVLLAGMEKFCATLKCRHQAIVNYFGQQLPAENCGACDVCLNELEFVADALVIAQKILSCVLRLQERYGAGYVSQVLVGSREQRITAAGHEQLSTFGILAEHDRAQVRAWTEQLVEQQFLAKSNDEYGVLRVTPAGRQLLRGEMAPQLLRPADRPRRKSKAEADSWEGVDTGLFEELRKLRRQKAEERGLPPFAVFSDVTLRDLARRRPSTPERMLAVHGIGETKCEQYAGDVLPLIADYCGQHDVPLDVAVAAAPARARKSAGERPLSPIKQQALDLFSQGMSVDHVCRATGRAHSTVEEYLVEFIDERATCDPSAWLEPAVFEQIRQAAAKAGLERMKPIFEVLGGAVGYDQIRIAVACLRNAAGSQSGSTQASSKQPSEPTSVD